MVADQDASWQLSRIHDVDGSYQSNKKYADYKFEPEEWKMLDLIQEVLVVSLNLPHIVYLLTVT